MTTGDAITKAVSLRQASAESRLLTGEYDDPDEENAVIIQAAARIQALIDAAREEGRKEGLAIAHATEERLAKSQRESLMSEHTSTPWKLDDGSIMTEAGLIIADLWNPGARNPQGNGEFIVLACNQHDALTAKAAMLDEAMAALTAVKRRLHFVGMPQEARFADGTTDWAKEIAMIEAVLAKVREKGD